MVPSVLPPLEHPLWHVTHSVSPQECFDALFGREVLHQRLRRNVPDAGVARRRGDGRDLGLVDVASEVDSEEPPLCSEVNLCVVGDEQIDIAVQVVD